MAENNFDFNKNIERAEELKNAFGAINNEVQAFNRALRAAGEDGAEVSAIFAKLKTSADKVGEVQERARVSTQGTAAAVKQVADNQNRAKQLAAQAEDFYQKAQRATGETKDNLLTQARNLSDASSEAKILSELYQQIANEAARLDNSTKFFRTAKDFISSIPGFKAFSKPFEDAEVAARMAVAKTGSTIKGLGAGLKAMGKGLADLLTIPALVAGTLSVSKNTKALSTSLGMSMDSARDLQRSFVGIVESSESSRFTVTKLTEAQIKLTQQLGLAVPFSEDALKNFIQLSEYIGVSEQSAARLVQISEGLGVNSSTFTDNIAESVVQANKALGVNIPLKDTFELIGKASASTLINLQRNPEVLAKAVVQVAALGATFEQVNQSANSLLSFESSIEAELSAELLTGRQLNLERARSLALQGRQGELAAELKNQIGSISDFEKLNVIQREQLSQAFGLNVDQLSEMLLKQEALNANAKAARDLSNDQIKQARDLAKEEGIGFGQALSRIQEERDAAKAFEDAAKSLKDTFSKLFIDLAPKLESIAETIGDLASSPFFRGLTKVGAGAIALASIARTFNIIPQRVFVVNQMGAAGAAGGGMFSTYGAGANSSALSAARGRGLSNAQIRSGFGGRAAMTGLRSQTLAMRGAGVGALATLGGAAMMQSENENVRVAGGALSGAGTGAMIGGMFGLPGMAIGATLGAAIGGLTSYMQKKDREEEKKKQEEANRQSEKYDKMIKLLEDQAKKDTKIFMDANQVGISMALGNPRLN